MAREPIDTLSMPTPHGRAEARHMGAAESGQSRWQVRFPWGAETFFGTSADIFRHMRMRVVQHEAASGSRTPG